MNGEFITYGDLGAYLAFAFLVGVLCGLFIARQIYRTVKAEKSRTKEQQSQ